MYTCYVEVNVKTLIALGIVASRALLCLITGHLRK